MAHTKTTVTLQSVDIGIGSVPCARTGDPTGRPAVVLIHGFSDSWRSFQPVLELLPDDVHALAPTLRGHGDAPRPEAGYDITHLADDVVQMMDAAGIGDAVIVGHSLGASIAARLVVDHPARARALVLVGAIPTPADNDGVAELAGAVRALEDPVDPAFVTEFQRSTIHGSVPAPFFDLVVGESLKLPAQVWHRVLDGFLAGGHIDTSRIAVPTMILWGDRDTLTSHADQDALRTSSAGGSELFVYERTGHAVHWERPQAVADDIVRLRRTVSRPAS